MSLPSSLLECDRCFSCGSINKRKSIRSCSNCQRSFHLSCVGLTRNASASLVVWSCSYCLSLSALQDSVIHQHNERTQRDASEVLRATSLLRKFRKVPLKIPKSVRIPAADALATAIDRALNLNSSLGRDYLFSFETLVLGISYNKDPKSPVSSIMKNNISLFNSSKINATKFSNLSNSNRFHPSSTVDDSKRLRALINAKLIEGDVSAAVRVLASSDTILATTPEVLTALRRKHPAQPSDIRFVQMEKKTDSNIEISKEAMVTALKSFSGSSSGDVIGLNFCPHCRSW
ncbi:unnamed protein product [Acanthosepion pharaonis]|uniref:PHD-type domain-containing protein n=1 Tax=Acanthosepion pharaonis TaxID=158019 RepID=A0A812ELT9_ACAPH|nr:unnamed protein product [Sepia pharaonis]